MFKKMLSIVLGILLYSFAANASLISGGVASQYGDIDKLDGKVLSDGSFNYEHLRWLTGEGIGDVVGITDTWLRPDGQKISWHQPGFAGALEEVTSAFVIFGHGGFGLYGAPTLSLLGQELGTISTSPYGVSENRYYVDVFSVSNIVGLLGEDLDFSLNFTGIGDNGAIDHITVIAFGTTPSPVPIPATGLLFGSGIAGLAGMRRYQEKRKGKNIDKV